jgi:Ni,Fe-hydrogenase III small subunit/formate hydrogenlyase subunit 6/NADH:ubiquinone oxidoreductase subunit I
MFNVLRQSQKTGVVTTSYPATPAEVSPRTRGRPEIDWSAWKDARPAAAVCPTGAIACVDADGHRTATFDLAKCIFCGLCADADPAIRMTTVCECAARSRAALVAQATYALKPDGTHASLTNGPEGGVAAGSACSELVERADPGSRPQRGQLQVGGTTADKAALDAVGRELKARTDKLLGRSLHIREVDAGSCNGCEIEIVGLNSPIYDAERFGVHFVASPRHADMLLVTGPVTRNMELALRKTYDAMPGPRLVVAVGACGCSGGIFGVNYATRGAVDVVIPVDVYVPGCPPNPHALLHGILTAVGRFPGSKKEV